MQGRASCLATGAGKGRSLHELRGSGAVDSLSACPALLRSLCEVGPCRAVYAAMPPGSREPPHGRQPRGVSCSLILRSLPREPLFVRARRVQTFLYRPAFRGCEPRVWLAACFALLCCRFCWQVPGKPCRAWATRRSHGGRFVAIADSPRVRSAWTVWPSGLRRWLKAPFRKGVGSNPTAVIFAQM